MGVIEHEEICKKGTLCQEHRSLISWILVDMGEYGPGFPDTETSIDSIKKRLNWRKTPKELAAVVNNLINAEDHKEYGEMIKQARLLSEMIRHFVSPIIALLAMLGGL